MTERLHKVLAHAGVASRRAAEQMIRDRRVRVNGAVVLEMGTQVDPERDAIEVDGRRLANVEASADHIYVVLNKPLGVVSTVRDPERRPTVVEMVNASRRLYPVGRLDIDSEGLVLLTDDGELTFRLTQARFAVEKEYHVLVNGPDLGEHVLERMAHESFGYDSAGWSGARGAGRRSQAAGTPHVQRPGLRRRRAAAGPHWPAAPR